MSRTWIIDFIQQNIISILVGVWTIFTYLHQNKINKIAEKEKASLQKEINKTLEKQKLKNQTYLTKFSLFATKKHEHYIELYEKTNNALVLLSARFAAFKEIPSFIDYGEQDVELFLKNIPITNFEKNRILCIWKENHEKGCKALRILDEKVKDHNAINSVIGAKDAFLQARLYLSKILADEIEKYLNELYFFANEIKDSNELRYEGQYVKSIRKQPQKMDELEKKFEKIIEQL